MKHKLIQKLSKKLEKSNLKTQAAVFTGLSKNPKIAEAQQDLCKLMAFYLGIEADKLQNQQPYKQMMKATAQLDNENPKKKEVWTMVWQSPKYAEYWLSRAAIALEQNHTDDPRLAKVSFLPKYAEVTEWNT